MSLSIVSRERERDAPLSFKTSFPRGSYNIMLSWEANPNCCAWPGVECDNATKGHVVGLHLRYSDSTPYIDMLINQVVDSSLLELKYLSYLDLSGNDFRWSPIPSFVGSVPHQIGNMSSLRIPDLGGRQYKNNLTVDDLCTWAVNLSSLEYLDMSNVNLNATNDLLKFSFEGTLSEAHFANLSKLENIGLESNHALKFSVGYDWLPTFHKLDTLNMASVEIGSQFPEWLQAQKSLTELRLSNCSSITGMLPKWLGSFMNLTILDLSDNHIEGPIPDSLCCEIKTLTHLDLSKNRLSLNNNSLTWEIPSSLQNCKGLLVLDIGDNMLHGKLPEWIGNDMQELMLV
ncbi:hypothetical protein CASFOL_002534 [Castilleja foliolosa]|uniref:Leucine-rich repeat-containing N-terminal plant-type domain-containing protein n=1 Tax=Castilleja foliolosa TaxID=1961234 RepID=A0ABD3EEL4_9LAMI